LAGFFQRNVMGLLLSVGLSFTLWAVVVNEQNPEVTRVFEPTIPVEMRNIPTGLVVQGVRDETVRLRMTTTLDHWESVSTTSFRAYVDLARSEPGAREYRIEAESSDRRVRIEAVEPSQTEVRLSVQKRKTVPVRVDFTDSVPFGYESRPPVVNPTQVEIIGPQSMVEQVVDAVVSIPLNGARTSINQAFLPEPRDGTGRPVRGLEVNPQTVSVEVPIEQQVAYKLISVVPDIVGSVALGYQIVGVTPDPALVTVVGEPQALDRLTQVSTQPIDVTELRNDLHQTRELVLPAGVSLARKQEVVVRVYVNDITGSQTVRVAPTARGVPTDAEATVLPGAVDVTVTGPLPSLLKL
jgi:YbbR domain-containing protein